MTGLIAFFRKPLGWLVAALIVLGLVWAAYSAITANWRTKARLARNQTEAASQSGSDAVNAVAGAADREAAGDALTRTNDSAIRNAEGADAEVAEPVNDAGLAALCRRAAHRDSPRCKNR